MQTVMTSSRRGAIGQFAEYAGAKVLAGAGGHGAELPDIEDPHIEWHRQALALRATTGGGGLADDEARLGRRAKRPSRDPLQAVASANTSLRPAG